MEALMRGIAAVITMATLCATWAPAFAQTFPTGTVRIVVPFPPSGIGATDIVARLIAQKLDILWPHPVIVDNKPGAGVTIGTNVVAKAIPDGHSLLLTINAHAIAKSLYRQLPYHPIDDFAPVILVGTSPNVLVIDPSLQAATVPEFIALAKKNPNQLTFASAGPGSGSHLAGQLFKTLAGVEMVHVPYKGIVPGLQDVIAGRVSAAFSVFSSVNPHVRAGKLRALAVTSAERSSLAPQLPAVQEFGIKGFDVVTWFGIFAPAGTPATVVAAINRDVMTVLQARDVQERFIQLGIEIKGGTPAEFGKFVESEWAMWDKIIKDSGIRIE